MACFSYMESSGKVRTLHFLIKDRARMSRSVTACNTGGFVNSAPRCLVLEQSVTVRVVVEAIVYMGGRFVSRCRMDVTARSTPSPRCRGRSMEFAQSKG